MTWPKIPFYLILPMFIPSFSFNIDRPVLKLWIFTYFSDMLTFFIVKKDFLFILCFLVLIYLTCIGVILFCILIQTLCVIKAFFYLYLLSILVCNPFCPLSKSELRCHFFISINLFNYLFSFVCFCLNPFDCQWSTRLLIYNLLPIFML